jgi:plasmid maintenance system killer protein
VTGSSYGSLEFTETFLSKLTSRDFTSADRSAILKALRLLDRDEKHPSLRLHKLEGDRAGAWSVSASSSLRITFERLAGGRKRLLTCSKHYDR